MAKKNNLMKVWNKLSFPSKTFITVFVTLVVFLGLWLVKDGVTEIIDSKGWSPVTRILIGAGLLMFIVVSGWWSAKKIKFA